MNELSLAKKFEVGFKALLISPYCPRVEERCSVSIVPQEEVTEKSADLTSQFQLIIWSAHASQLILCVKQHLVPQGTHILTLSSEAPSRCILEEEGDVTASSISAMPAHIRTWTNGVLGDLIFLESNNHKSTGF